MNWRSITRRKGEITQIQARAPGPVTSSQQSHLARLRHREPGVHEIRDAPLAVTEVCHLLADPRRRGHNDLAAEFCAAIAAGELRVIEVAPPDYRRMAELLTTYAPLRLQVVDACIVALAAHLMLVGWPGLFACGRVRLVACAAHLDEKRHRLTRERLAG